MRFPGDAHSRPLDAATSLTVINTAQRLVDTGRHAAVADYLTAVPEAERARSPTLALLYGIATARLGALGKGQAWVRTALERARERGDNAVEVRALNVLGVIAFEGGRIDDAAQYFTRALAEAERLGDHATVGRCSNNLGAIASLRGDYGRAVGSYTMALAAFQQALHRTGIAETLHNLAITYREQGDLQRALETADRAVQAAEEAGDLQLGAQTRAGRAEIRVEAGEPAVARREVELALETHRQLGSAVGVAEDLRVLAGAMAALDQVDEAERMLHEVLTQADAQGRPLLAAQAERDLAWVLERRGMVEEAAERARTARVRFLELGAEAEARRLDVLLERLGAAMEGGRRRGSSA